MIRICVQKKLRMADGINTLNVDIEIPDHSFTTLYGPSGAGKTTLLRIIAGLLMPEKGIIEVGGATWLHTEKKINLPPQKRNIGFVFQDYALFPNMTIAENLRYALPAGGKKDSVFEILKMVGLDSFADQRPSSLSGGQKQRVALVRALIRQPGILLLDEPLSALDHTTRLDLQREIQAIHRQRNLTTFLVTHHIPDICRLADHVIKLENAKIIQSGSPDEIFNLQRSEEKVSLIGEVITIDADLTRILTDHGFISLKTGDNIAGLSAGDKVMIHAADFSIHKLL